MKNIKLLAAMCLIIGIAMIIGEVLFDTAAFLPKNTVNFAVAFGLIIVGTALGMVWRELTIIHRRLEKQTPGTDTHNEK